MDRDHADRLPEGGELMERPAGCLSHKENMYD